jgi:peptidoglycan/xylan/chitin deacetylase (PgdA/CDA1 family)
LKKILLYILSGIAQLFPLKLLIKLSGIHVIYPFYHLVSDHPPEHVKHLYSVRSLEQFKKDLDFFLKFFKPIDNIPVDPLQSNQNTFFISFDDGLSECFEAIAPILKTYGINACFFINTDFIDNKDLFYKFQASIIIEKINSELISDEVLYQLCKIAKVNNKVRFEKKLRHLSYNSRHMLVEIARLLNIDVPDYTLHHNVYMSFEQLEKLSKEGHIIGSHGKSHPLFSEIPFDRQLEEVNDSIEYINRTLNPKLKLFAFPFTDHNIDFRLFDYIATKQIVDFTFGTAGIKKDSVISNIQRIPMEKSKASAKYQIKAQYFMYLLKRLVNKHEIVRDFKEF